MTSTAARIGRFEVLGRLARGSTADVLLARPVGPSGPVPPARVALKRLYPHLVDDEDFVRMFVDEIRLMSRLRHRGVVGVLDLDDDGETWFAVLELVDGPNLQAASRLLAAQGRPFPVAAAVAVAARVAEALHAAHELSCPDTGAPLQLVHRDVNPPNILVGRGADGGVVVKLADFGVARSTAGRQSGFLSGRDTRGGLRKGRASTLSPEQVRGEPVDRRADLWGLGVTLFMTLTGTAPFTGSGDVALFDAILGARPPRLRELRPDLDDDARLGPLQRLVDDLLQKDPALRPVDAAGVAARLREIVAPAEEEAAVRGVVDGLGLPSLRA